jgi:pilus assembly protein Flp/PilA
MAPRRYWMHDRYPKARVWARSAALAAGARDSIGKEVTVSMYLVNELIAPFRRDEEGQGLAEYALILALIAIVAIVALIFLGGKVSQILSDVGNSV